MVSGAGPSGRQYHVAVLDPEGRMWLHNGDLGWKDHAESNDGNGSMAWGNESQLNGHS